MKNLNIEQQALISKFRRENTWAIPGLLAGMGLVAFFVSVLELSSLGLAAMVSMAALFAVGILKAARIRRQSDEQMLRSAAQYDWGMYAWLAATVVGLGIGTDMNTGITLLIIGFALHADSLRVKDARQLQAAQ